MNIIENQVKTLFNHIYLLQQENYQLSRFLASVSPTLFSQAVQREERTVWTDKLLIVTGIALVLHFLAAYMVAWIIGYFLPLDWLIQPLLIVAVFIVLMSVHHIFLTLATLAVWPLDYGLKNYLIYKARTIVRAHPGLRIIAVAGSYGKTSMKETLAAVLSEEKTVLKTRENLNTPLAISRLIREELTDEIDAFVVEMGEYQKGDIQKIAEVVPPDIVVVTGINEAHLERMKTESIILSTIFEAVEFSKPTAQIILNADDARIMENYEKYLQGRRAHFFSQQGAESSYTAHGISYDADRPGVSFEVEKGEEHLTFKTHILGDYVVSNTIAALIVAEEMGISLPSVKKAVEELSPLKRRLEPVQSRDGFVVIDDTYNASAESALSGLASFVNFFPKAKKAVVFGDMLELGPATLEHHERVGEYIGRVVKPELLVLVGEHVDETARAALEAGFSEENIRQYGSVEELMGVSIAWKEVADAVFVKGSNGMRLNKLVESLRERRALV